MTKLANDTSTKTDWNKIRSQFPVLDQKINGQDLVYLDNAASSQMPVIVSDRIDHYHKKEHSNVHRGIHSLSQKATDAYESTRTKVQEFINARHKEEIIFTTGTTDSINLVAQSYGRKNFNTGDEIILSEMEHHANIVPWQLIAEETGAVLRIVPMNDAGELDMDTYESLLSEKTKMVAIVHVSNALGTVNPVKEIINLAHQNESLVLIDGAQAVPHSKVDIQDLDADFYTFSAHKMCGPTGFGVLYGKKEILQDMPPYRGGGDMIDKVTFEETTWNDLPYKFEAGTPPIAAGIGLGSAIDYLNEIGMDEIASREAQLLDYATKRINDLEGVRIIGTAKDKASVISFLIDNIHSTDAGTILDQKGIAVRTGHHCAQPIMQHYDIPGTARASISFYNTEEDIDKLIDGIKYVKDFFS
ncbi:aminotransferase class V-fold PLP-dependent enzyme [Balneola sp. MJW-20]|uniref:aminotransferase class V-fold PLP-dependent enzyme n=1 Tax=Gracilimonas aurantiaca TaxID=3234185 RepID=UPI00346573DF